MLSHGDLLKTKNNNKKLEHKSLSVDENQDENLENDELIFQSLTSLASDTFTNRSPSPDEQKSNSKNKTKKSKILSSTLKSFRLKPSKNSISKMNENFSLSPSKVSVTSSGSNTTTNSSTNCVSSNNKTTKTKPSSFVKKLTSLSKKNKVKDTNSSDDKMKGFRKFGDMKSGKLKSSSSASNLKQQKADAGGLSKSLSEISLLEMDEEKEIFEGKQENKRNTFIVSQQPIPQPPPSPSPIISKTIQLPVEPISNNKSMKPSTTDHITSSVVINLKQPNNNPINNNVITRSDIAEVTTQNDIDVDIPPSSKAPSVPYKFNDGDILNLLKSSDYRLSNNNNNNNSGAIKKQPKSLRDEFFETLNAKNSNSKDSAEILKIIEKSDIKRNNFIVLQDPPTLFNIGNNLQNPNLSSFDSNNSFSETENQIKFNIGKLVRPPFLHQESKIKYSVDDFNSFDSNVNSGVESGFNLISSSIPSRSLSAQSPSLLLQRKISFKQQPTIYTEEEKEFIRRGFINKDNVDDIEEIINHNGDQQTSSYLSFLSGYSLDSELSCSSGCCDITSNYNMSPHGDLISSEIVTPSMTTIESGPSQASSSVLSQEKREYLYKILVIGELGTGKTSFIRRYVHNFFSQNYRATIGVDFALKVLNWDQKSIIRLQLWDIAGQERFGNMTRVYYKEAAGAFIVFDVTRSATFDAVIKWKQDLDAKVQLPDGSPIPCILLANKCDQPKQGAASSSSKLDEYVKEHKFAGWYETSAKDNINIEDAAKALVNKILQNDRLLNAGVVLDNDKIALVGQNEQTQKKNCLQC